MMMCLLAMMLLAIPIGAQYPCCGANGFGKLNVTDATFTPESIAQINDYCLGFPIPTPPPNNCGECAFKPTLQLNQRCDTVIAMVPVVARHLRKWNFYCDYVRYFTNYADFVEAFMYGVSIRQCKVDYPYCKATGFENLNLTDATFTPESIAQINEYCGGLYFPPTQDNCGECAYKVSFQYNSRCDTVVAMIPVGVRHMSRFDMLCNYVRYYTSYDDFMDAFIAGFGVHQCDPQE
jgi:hypothetical protein